MLHFPRLDQNPHKRLTADQSDVIQGFRESLTRTLAAPGLSALPGMEVRGRFPSNTWSGWRKEKEGSGWQDLRSSCC